MDETTSSSCAVTARHTLRADRALHTAIAHMPSSSVADRNARSRIWWTFSKTSCVTGSLAIFMANAVGHRRRRTFLRGNNATARRYVENVGEGAAPPGKDDSKEAVVEGAESPDLLLYGEWCALVINLARRLDRLQRTKEVFAERAPRIFERLERIDAVDGRELNFCDESMKDILEASTLANAKRAKEIGLYTVVHDENNLLVHFDDHFTEGAVACALSHRKALTRIATHPEAEWGLIFEDDVSMVVPNVEDAIGRMMKKLPADWEAVYLGYHHDDGKPHPAAVDPALAQVQPVDVRISPVFDHCWGLFSLMIRKQAARELVDNLFPLRTQVDCAVSSWLVRHRGRVFKVPPEELLFYSSCSEEAQDTDIQTMKSDRDIEREYGSVEAYRDLQRQRPTSNQYDPELLNPLLEYGAESEPWTASSFSLVGSFNDWTIAESAADIMVVSADAAPAIGAEEDLRREEFQLVGDGSWEKRVFPAGGSREAVVLLHPGKPARAAQGDGSRGRGHGRNWAIDGSPGASFRITYDPATRTVVCEAL